VGGGVSLTNIQCKAIQNCHKEPSLYNEYMLTKNFKSSNIKKVFMFKKTVERYISLRSQRYHSG
jgi:hypothetical protein